MNNFYKKFNPSPSENPELYAAIYSRKSSNNANNSIESQESVGMEVLHQKNLLLYDKYSDVISATKKPLTARKNFMRMYSDAKNGLFKNIIVFKRDRLARDFSEWLKIKDFLTQHKIRIIYSDGTDFNPDKKNTIDNFIDNIVFGVAEFEPQQLSERCSNGILKKHERGEYYSGTKARGYDRIEYEKEKRNIEERLEKDKSLEKKYPLLIQYVLNNKCSLYLPNKDEVTIIKQIFDLYVNLKEEETIEKHMLPILNEEKKSMEVSNNKRFDSQRIKNIIQNPVYCGMGLKKEYTSLKFKDFFRKVNDSKEYLLDQNIFQPLRNVVPIIDKEKWEKAALLRRNQYIPRENKATPHLFKDLLYCGKCKLKDGEMRKINLSSIKYYRCNTPSCFSAKVKDLEKLLISKIIDDITTHELSKSINLYTKKINTEIKCLKQTFEQKLKTKDQKLFEYIESPADKEKEESLKEIVTEIKNIHKNISERNLILADLKYANNQLKSEKEKIKGAIDTEALINQLEKDIQQSNIFLKSIIEKVVLIKESKRYEIQYKSKYNSIC